MNGKIFRGWWALLLCVSVWVHAQDADPLRIELELNNGNQVSGTYLSGSEKSLQLKPYWLDQPLQVDIKDLKRFQQLKPQEGIPGVGKYRLHFPDGNYLTVASVLLGPEGFIVRPLWEGEMLVPVRALARVEFLDPTGLLYHGPSLRLPGTDQKVPWELLIPRPGMQWQTDPIQFPEKFQLEIEMIPSAKNFIYHISLFDWRTRAWGSVVFEMTADQASAAWYLRTAPNRLNVKNWREKLPEGGERQQLRFYVNLPGKEITLMVNGKRIHTWQGELTESLRVNGPSTIGFRYLSGNGELIIKSIRLYPWGGEYPYREGEALKDLLIFKNGERVSGVLTEMTEKEVRFLKGEQGEVVTVPVEEILEIMLSPGDKARDRVLPQSAAKLYVARGQEPIYMDVHSLGAGTLSGEVCTGADAFHLSVPLSEVKRIEFQEVPMS